MRVSVIPKQVTWERHEEAEWGVWKTNRQPSSYGNGRAINSRVTDDIGKGQPIGTYALQKGLQTIAMEQDDVHHDLCGCSANPDAKAKMNQKKQRQAQAPKPRTFGEIARGDHRCHGDAADEWNH